MLKSNFFIDDFDFFSIKYGNTFQICDVIYYFQKLIMEVICS